MEEEKENADKGGMVQLSPPWRYIYICMHASLLICMCVSQAAETLSVKALCVMMMIIATNSRVHKEEKERGEGGGEGGIWWNLRGGGGDC